MEGIFCYPTQQTCGGKQTGDQRDRSDDCDEPTQKSFSNNIMCFVSATRAMWPVRSEGLTPVATISPKG